jgi:hypothetical protein
LDDWSHEWWRRGMLQRLRRDRRTSGLGREEGIVNDIERRARDLRARYDVDGDAFRDVVVGVFGSGAHLDAAARSRDASHVKHACRALATLRALRPWINDDAALIPLIREHNGGERLAARMVNAGVAAAVTMSRDKVGLCVKLLRGLAYDHGDVGWDWREAPTPTGARAETDAGGGGDDPEVVFEMRTSRCLYHSVFAAEGEGALASATCCAVDGASWFESGGGGGGGGRDWFGGVAVARTETLSAGDARCTLRVTRRGGGR